MGESVNSYIVYKVTNVIAGITTKDLKTRWENHVYVSSQVSRGL